MDSNLKITELIIVDSDGSEESVEEIIATKTKGKKAALGEVGN